MFGHLCEGQLGSRPPFSRLQCCYISALCHAGVRTSTAQLANNANTRAIRPENRGKMPVTLFGLWRYRPPSLPHRQACLFSSSRCGNRRRNCRTARTGALANYAKLRQPPNMGANGLSFIMLCWPTPGLSRYSDCIQRIGHGETFTTSPPGSPARSSTAFRSASNLGNKISCSPPGQ